MTKKILGVLSIIALSLVSLSSCGGESEDLSRNRQAIISSSTAEKYNLNFNNENGSLLVEKDNYSLYLATDVKASLVTYTVDVLQLKDLDGNNLVETEGEKLRNINSKTLVFSEGLSALYTSEVTQYINMLYDGTDGVGKVLTRDSLGFNPDLKPSWTKTSDLKTAYEYYKNNDLSELKLEIVYLPTYFVRKNEGIVVMEQHILAPIYMTYTTENSSKEIVNGELVDSNISSIKKSEFKFVENSNAVLEK